MFWCSGGTYCRGRVNLVRLPKTWQSWKVRRRIRQLQTLTRGRQKCKDIQYVFLHTDYSDDLTLVSPAVAKDARYLWWFCSQSSFAFQSKKLCHWFMWRADTGLLRNYGTHEVIETLRSCYGYLSLSQSCSNFSARHVSTRLLRVLGDIMIAKMLITFWLISSNGERY